MFACENIKDSLTAIGNPVEAARRQAEIDRLKKIFFAQGGKIYVEPVKDATPRSVVARKPVKTKRKAAKPNSYYLSRAYARINKEELARWSSVHSNDPESVICPEELAALLGVALSSAVAASSNDATRIQFGREVNPCSRRPVFWLVSDVLEWVDSVRERIGA